MNAQGGERVRWLDFPAPRRYFPNSFYPSQLPTRPDGCYLVHPSKALNPMLNLESPNPLPPPCRIPLKNLRRSFGYAES